MKRYFICLFIPFFLFASCAPKPNPDAQIQLAVAQTIAAIPTYTPYPTPRILPTATPMNLSGLFCEYQFCIGHPVSIAFFDLDAQHNPQTPSSITQGILVAYDATVVIQIMWQDATGASDASFMLDTIIDSKVDFTKWRLEGISSWRYKYRLCCDHKHRDFISSLRRRGGLDVRRARLCVESLHPSSGSRRKPAQSSIAEISVQLIKHFSRRNKLWQRI